MPCTWNMPCHPLRFLFYRFSYIASLGGGRVSLLISGRTQVQHRVVEDRTPRRRIQCGEESRMERHGVESCTLRTMTLLKRFHVILMLRSSVNIEIRIFCGGSSPGCFLACAERVFASKTTCRCYKLVSSGILVQRPFSQPRCEANQKKWDGPLSVGRCKVSWTCDGSIPWLEAKHRVKCSKWKTESPLNIPTVRSGRTVGISSEK